MSQSSEKSDIKLKLAQSRWDEWYQQALQGEQVLLNQISELHREIENNKYVR